MITGIKLMFRKPPITFYRVSMIAIVRDKLFVMVNRFMRETMFFKPFIAFPTVCINCAAFFYMLLNKFFKCVAFNIRNSNSSYFAIPLNNPNNRSFASSPSAAFAFALPAKIGFINFY